MTIGLTGGIGAGKSVVSRILRSKGYEVFDCDSEARRLMDGSERIKDALRSHFGDFCITPDGLPDRKVIASIVFDDKQHLHWLNALIHGEIFAKVKNRIKLNADNLLFVESAILASSGLSQLCECIWLVSAPEDIRLRRACSRDCASEKEISSRIKAQEEEISLLIRDFNVDIIDNSGSLPLLPQINELLTQIL